MLTRKRVVQGGYTVENNFCMDFLSVRQIFIIYLLVQLHPATGVQTAQGRPSLALMGSLEINMNLFTKFWEISWKNYLMRLKFRKNRNPCKKKKEENPHTALKTGYLVILYSKRVWLFLMWYENSSRKHRQRTAGNSERRDTNGQLNSMQIKIYAKLNAN